MRRVTVLLIAVVTLASGAIWMFPSSGRAAEEASPVYIFTRYAR
jgi:hypothetical protein